MNFIVSTSELLNKLQIINGVIGINTVLPILEDILFDIDKMTFFNALCHSMATISTGGFSIFNNYVYMNTSDMPGSWRDSFFGKNVYK